MQEPRKEWLDFAKTRHARNKIKHALHERGREVRRKEGLEMLEREFRNHNLNLNRLTREGRMELESRQRKNQEFEHILFCIGDGSIRSEEIRRWFSEDPNSSSTIPTPESPSQPEIKARTQKKKFLATSSASMILVDGMDNVVTRIAQCCSPEKNHSIQGYLTQARVIAIHKDNCSFLQKLSPERMVKVRWRGGK
jgi:GTP pyrophosphokinase